MSNHTRTADARLRSRRYYAAALFALLFVCCVPLSSALAQKRDSRDGMLQISTTPGGFPILIDGRPAGETTSFARTFDLPPGPHTVEIFFPGGNRWAHNLDIQTRRKECISLNYSPRSIEVPRASVSPCPYPVNVSAPATAGDGDIITFTADVNYEGPSALNYTWTVSPPAARIISGAGTPTITVDSTGLGRRRVTAILVVDDGSGDRNCRQTAQASTSILTLVAPVITPRRFDEFPSVAFDDDKARLDNLAVELQNNPGSRGYIIAYAGRNSRAGTADGLGERARRYLIETRGMDANRIEVVNGGYRESNSYEIWLVPTGAQAPVPTPTLQPGGINLRPARRPSRRR